MGNQKMFKGRDKREKGWFWVNNDYLNGYAKIFGAVGTAIYISLCRHADNETQQCFPAIETIAEELKISKRTVIKYVKMFKEWNLIEIHREKDPKTKRWKNNVYTLLDNKYWKKPGERSAPGNSEEKPGELEGKSQVNVVHHNKTHINKTHIIINTAKQSFAEKSVHFSKEIPQLFEIFQKTINPTINYANKTQRKAACTLFKTFGVEKTLTIARYAVSIQGKKFAPVITNPYQLKEKIGELAAFSKREQSNVAIYDTPSD